MQLTDFEKLQAERATTDLHFFCKLMWKAVEPNYKFLDNFHLAVMARHLEALYNYQIPGLLITLPPRCCKTILTTIMFPVWCWLRDPGRNFMCASYALDVSITDHAKARRLIASPLFQSYFADRLTIAAKPDTQHIFQTTKGGFRYATSTGGPVTSKGCDILILDDAINAKKAHSEVERNNCIEWYDNTWHNRINDLNKCGRVVIGQRLHLEDLPAHIVKTYPELYTHLNLPYEYNSVTTAFLGAEILQCRDPRKEDGEPLWPERFPESEIKGLKKKRNVWASQYLQNPADREYSLFRHEDFLTYTSTFDQESKQTIYNLNGRTIKQRDCYRLAAADLAIAKRGDFTAIAVADISPSGDIIFIHALKRRVESVKLIPTIIAITNEYSPTHFIMESNAFQRVILDDCKRLGVPVKPIQPYDNKEIRSITLQTRVQDGKVWVNADAKWSETLIRDCCNFPHGSDDLVDAACYIGIIANKRFRSYFESKPKVLNKEEQEASDKKRWLERLWEGLD